MAAESQLGEEPLRYIVLYEREGDAYGAYLPDVPGCIATSNLHSANGPEAFPVNYRGAEQVSSARRV